MEQRILRIIGIAFDKDVSDMKIADCVPENIESWDSMNFINLIMLLEEEFAVSFELEDIDEMSNGGESILATIERVAGT